MKLSEQQDEINKAIEIKKLQLSSKLLPLYREFTEETGLVPMRVVSTIQSFTNGTKAIVKLEISTE